MKDRVIRPATAKRWLALLFLLCLLPGRALAGESTGYTFSHNPLGTDLVIVRDAYQPRGVYQGLGLKSPQDLAVSGGRIYIADTGNRRVLSIDIRTGEILEIKGLFAQPVGVAADGQGRVYVADYQKGCVFRFSADGALEMTYERPQSPVYGAENLFKPKVVAPAGDGGVYVVADGASNGIVQMNAQGQFVGFFASNAVRIPLIYKFYDLILTDEQMLRYGQGTPGAFGSIIMGVDGLVYALESGNGVRLQKLSYTGVNLFTGTRKRPHLAYPVDMAMMADGTVYILHQAGYITQVSRDGVFLYRFGGAVLDVAREGLVQTPAGIGVDDAGDIYVLDRATGQIHIYTPLSAQLLTQRAVNSYFAGDYEQAGALLDEVLKYNSNSYYARLYRGKSFMHMGDYHSAMAEFRYAKDKPEYSDAFWEVRNAFLQRNGLWVLLGLIALAVGLVLLRVLRPRKREAYNSYAQSYKLPSQWHGLLPRYLARSALHPIDTAYEIKQGHMGGYGAAAALLLLATAALLARTLLAGFLYSQDAEEFPALLYCGGILAVAALFIVCNSFITSIRDGEGTLSMIASVTAYALAPLVLCLPFITVACNALALQEALIVNTLTTALYILCFVNLSAMLMELHNYSLRQYLSSLILTLLFMVLCVLVFSLIYLLAKQCVDFIVRLWTEVAVRD